MALVSFDRDTHAAKGCTDLPPNPLSLNCVTTDFQPSKTTWSGGVKLRLKTRLECVYQCPYLLCVFCGCCSSRVAGKLHFPLVGVRAAVMLEWNSMHPQRLRC